MGGGASPPQFVRAGPASVLAVESKYGTSLYDRTGALVGTRPGSPVRFLPDGTLLVCGGEPAVRAYDPAGDMLWGRDPWPEARAKLGLTEEVRSCGGFVVSPSGYLYVPIDFYLGDGVTPALIVYNSRGEMVFCDRWPGGLGLILSPRGTVLGQPVEASDGWAWREFGVGDNGVAFALERTVFLPRDLSLYAAGRDGSFVAYSCSYKEVPRARTFTVYRAGRDRGVRFTLPEGAYEVDWTGDGRIYAMRLLEDYFEVTCWVWPTP